MYVCVCVRTRACVCVTEKCHSTVPTPTSLAHSGQCPLPDCFWPSGSCLCRGYSLSLASTSCGRWRSWPPAAAPPTPKPPGLHGSGLGPGRCLISKYASVARAREGKEGAQGPPGSCIWVYTRAGVGVRGTRLSWCAMAAPGASGHPQLLSHPIACSYNHGG